MATLGIAVTERTHIQRPKLGAKVVQSRRRCLSKMSVSGQEARLKTDRIDLFPSIAETRWCRSRTWPVR